MQRGAYELVQCQKYNLFFDRGKPFI